MIMKERIILCDADDVIENFTDCWIGVLNEEYGTNVNSKDVTDLDVSKFFPELTHEQVQAPTRGVKLCSKLERIDGCYEILKELDNRHTLRIVTATHYANCEPKILRILDLYPFLSWEKFVITQHKQLVNGHVLIDDYPDNLIGGLYEGILFSRPRNKSFDAESAGLTRVSGWDDIGRMLLA